MAEERGSNDFVKKLYMMLRKETYRDVVRWTPSGTSFVVLNTNEFTKEILPTHFKHSNFASFVRQLNKYDFHKVKMKPSEKQYGDDAWEFHHPDFRKDDSKALENIRRKAPSKKDSSELVNSQYSALVRDMAKMQKELSDSKKNYKSLMDSMLAHRAVSEQQSRALQVLVQCLTSAGIKVPALDLPSSAPMPYDKVNYPAKSFEKGFTEKGFEKGYDKNFEKSFEKDFEKGFDDKGIPNYTEDKGLEPEKAKPPLQPLNEPISQPINQPINASLNQPINANLNPSLNQPIQGQNQNPDAAPFETVTTTSIVNPKYHVLLVEDDNVCIQLCRKFLVKYGCQVTVVTDGLNAISTLEHTKYDLVLMDIVMPNLDGATATSIIRSFDTKTPIIAMTGNIQDNDLVTYLQNGMSDILAKPFTKNDLYSILSKYLSVVKQEFPEGTTVQEYGNMPLEGGGANVPIQRPISDLPPEPSPGLDHVMLEPMDSMDANKKQRLM